ncbi:MAG TPA: flagellar assembly protein FliH [Idiomarina loihiensis]|jgi:flagellar assembly protein FliH|uniref:Flagellar assembly protein FliH n=1 Tax=Idiomarina loihiensis (strain ATCC BAA-735 / DSM 15497 / L2-TR) TaxID=283942 RepID=Q5QTV7_IDILO|nr:MULTISPECIES: flagellar assembly protein FliH [Idiomarina]AAV82038.1 type III secretory pathway protein [Idiomarina loihiensis L2TR]AGM36068.1 flagellar assembly protein H [Idiomarina loihiensis GSL 199]HAS21783.1 flagellar assembly protein FliH [Idiomarina loihiensis]|tara:strand:- start:153 stop:902 length:750 start_codon:yes stop_codon:yes gene_type:complete
MTDDKDATQLWDLPDMTSEELKQGSQVNALNKPRRWQYEPPEADNEQEEELKPLTAEQLEEIRQAAREEGHKEGFDEGRNEGLKKGYDEGYEAGKKDGFEAGEQQGVEAGKEAMQEQQQQLRVLLQSLSHPNERITEAVQDELIDMVTELTRVICLDFAANSKELIVKAVREAIAVLPVTDQRVIIHLNEEDLAILQSTFSEDELKEKGWLLNKDDLLERGGCRVTTESSTIDYTLTSRMEDVFSKLKG